MILDAYFRIFWLLVKMRIPRLESNPTESEFLWMGSKHLYFVVTAPDSDSNVHTGLRTNDCH